MGKRPKKKIVLFLVEGKSDREALQIAISELYESIDEDIEVFFPIIHNGEEERGGDLTTSRYTDKRGRNKWVTPDNIEDALYSLFLEDFFDEKKIMPKDITEIVQIVDMDGAFVPDDCILLDPSLTEEQSTLYTDSHILCRDIDNIVDRNNRKRNNISFLCSTKTIKIKTQTKPYSIYYFSSNLDHFLHNDANLDHKQKRNLADAFSNRFIGDVDGFISMFSTDPGSTKEMTYNESWNYIKEGTRSLSRHTNINLLLQKLSSNGTI